MSNLIKIDNQEFNLDVKNETLFATQEQIANIFQVDRSVIVKHLKNIFECGELDKNSNVQKMHNSTKPIYLFSLDAIISVGYRVNSVKAVDFRKKATKILKEYLTTGEVKKVLPQINSAFLLQIAEEMQKKENLIAEQQHKIEVQDNTIQKISNTQDSYGITEAAKKLRLEKEKKIFDYLKSIKWIYRVSDGQEGSKWYSHSYGKGLDFIIDMEVLNKRHQSYYHQTRITKKGMDYLIKHREDILTF